MTRQEIKKLQEKELEAWNSYLVDKKNSTGTSLEKDWVSKQMYRWYGTHEVLEMLGIEIINDKRRLY